MFGYPSNEDYYRDASPIHNIKSVQVPMLCLNAADDVFSPNHGESTRFIRVAWEILARYKMCVCIFKKVCMVVTFKFGAEVNKSASWKGHNFIPSVFFFSHSSRCREAEPQCGPPHHMSRRPYWLPWGSVATAEHLHGPSFSAVHQGRVWERQRPKWSPLTLPFHYLSLQPLAKKKKKNSIHFQNEGHRFTWRPGLFFQSVHLFISLL